MIVKITEDIKYCTNRIKPIQSIVANNNVTSTAQNMLIGMFTCYQDHNSAIQTIKVRDDDLCLVMRHSTQSKT